MNFDSAFENKATNTCFITKLNIAKGLLDNLLGQPCLPYSYWTLEIMAFSSDMTASHTIPVRRASVLPAASFRFSLTTDTLAV